MAKSVNVAESVRKALEEKKKKNPKAYMSVREVDKTKKGKK